MVTNFPRFIFSDKGIRTGTNQASTERFGGRVIDRLRQVYCGMHGHDPFLQFKQTRMFLQCASCGHETPGWTLDETPPTVTMCADARRLSLVRRPQIVDQRRIA
jgi:hypothetical protein